MVENFIKEHLKNCVQELSSDEGIRIALPYPYSVPTETETFRDMFYWDTYFTNIGLLLTGEAEQAIHNTDNILYLVERFGFMPNASNYNALNRSQPPVLSLMVRDIFERFGDREWLKKAYSILEQEYDFWMTERICENGLNRYSGDITKIANPKRSAEYYLGRTGLKIDNPDYEKISEDMLAECESGWDFTPRFNCSASTFIAADLNSLLYAFERNMQYFSEILCNLQEGVWNKRALDRKRLMTELLWNGERGAFMDRDFKSGEWSKVFSAASYFALMCGVASEEQAAEMLKNLPLVELEYGISCCESSDNEGSFQWGYPNCWAPVQYGVIKGLERYGYLSDARRLADKYCSMLESCFEQTGNLWEKYNAEDGSVNVTDEYEMPPMLGWTAGVYLYCLKNRVGEHKGNYSPNRVLQNGKHWYDTNGNIISAHGGCIIKFENIYYWYGECRTNDSFVNCYSSEDLHNWKFEKTVLSGKSPYSPLAHTERVDLIDFEGNRSVLERPKVVYNAKTRKFVMWAHWEQSNSYSRAMCAVASSDTPNGEFVFHGVFNPLGYMSRDLTLYKEDDKVYMFSASNNNRDLHIYELSEDYLSVKKLCSKQFIGQYREAPAVFKKNGKYYMLTSYCTGWSPNQCKYSVSEKIFDGWSEPQDIDDYCTHKSQPAFILSISDDEQYYFGDRWGGEFWGGKGFNYENSTVVAWKISFDSKTGEPFLEHKDYF